MKMRCVFSFIVASGGGEGGGWRRSSGWGPGLTGTVNICKLPSRPAANSLLSSPFPSPANHCGQLTQFSKKSLFISFCPQRQNTAINSSSEHFGKQIATLTGDGAAREALLACTTRGLARGGGRPGVLDQLSVLTFRGNISALSSGMTGCVAGTPRLGRVGARCQPLARSPFQLSQHAQVHMRALQHWLPLFPLASPSCLLLWRDEPLPLTPPSFYSSVITQEQPRIIKKITHKGNVMNASIFFFFFGPPPLVSRTTDHHLFINRGSAPPIYWSTSIKGETTDFSSHPTIPSDGALRSAPLAKPSPSSPLAVASEGLSMVLMRISMFVLFICVPP